MKKKVLVAEDDQSILEVVKIILQDAGYDLISVSDGDQVMTQIHHHVPEIILLDIWMGGHDGAEIAKKIKAGEKTKHIPIIMMSANNETEKIAEQVGANDFLQKPFDVDDLLLKVKTHILE